MRPSPSLNWRCLPVAALALAGCVRSFALNAVADSLAGQGGGFATDDDPELVRAAAPFGLKTTEALIGQLPERGDLLVSAASGFTQYGYAFVQQQADFDDSVSTEKAAPEYARARKLYKRAVGYGLRALDVAHPGTSDKLRTAPAEALAAMTKADVPALYWTGAPWALRVVISKNDASLIADLGTVELLMKRALELDEPWAAGTIDEFFESFEAARPGVSAESARATAAKFRDRALELAHGQKLGPWVTWAESVDVSAQDRKEFDALTDKVLAFDIDSAPSYRLVNTLMQRRAKWLKSRADELFVAAGHPTPGLARK